MDRPQPDLLPNLAMAIAVEALETRFPGAVCAFVAGSIMRGQGTVRSDLDLVVLYPRLDQAWRESFESNDMPVEAFVQDPSTLAHYLEQDVQSGRPIMISMVAEGRIVGTDIGLARHWQSRARGLLAAGPRQAVDSWLLYQVSDLADDLRGLRPASEVRAIAMQLYPKLADLMLLGQGQWSGNGKWVPRRLSALGQEARDGFEAAMTAAFDGDGAALLALCDAELARYGGPLFDGYKALGVTSTQR